MRLWALTPGGARLCDRVQDEDRSVAGIANHGYWASADQIGPTRSASTVERRPFQPRVGGPNQPMIRSLALGGALASSVLDAERTSRHLVRITPHFGVAHRGR